MPHGWVSSAFTGAVMADVRTLTPRELDIIEARRSFLAADAAEDYETGDFWFGRLRELYDDLPHPRPAS